MSATDAATVGEARFREFFGCPGWCEADQHDVDIRTADGAPVTTHHGPWFGRGWVTASAESALVPREVEPIGFIVDVPLTQSFDAGKLRELAADIATALAWFDNIEGGVSRDG